MSDQGTVFPAAARTAVDPALDRFRTVARTSRVRRLALRLEPPAHIGEERLDEALHALAAEYPDSFAATLRRPDGSLVVDPDAAGITVRRVHVPEDAAALLLERFESEPGEHEDPGGSGPTLARALIATTPSGLRLSLILDRMLVDHADAGLLLSRLASLCGPAEDGTRPAPATDGASPPASGFASASADGSASASTAGPGSASASGLAPASAAGRASTSAAGPGSVPTDEQLARLRKELLGVPFDNVLPRIPALGDHTRPPAWSRHRFVLPDDLLAAAAALAALGGEAAPGAPGGGGAAAALTGGQVDAVPGGEVLVAAWALVLHRWSRLGELVVGVETDRVRPGRRPRGAVAEVLPVVTHTGGLRAVAGQVAEGVRRGLDEATLPAPLLAQFAGRLVSEQSPSPYASVVALRPALPAEWNATEATDPATETELELVITSGGAAEIRYRSDAFTRRTITALARHFLRLLRSGLDAPDAPHHRLVMLDEQDTHELLHEFSDLPDRWEPQAALHTLVEQHARRSPGTLAVVRGAERITYGELNARANRLAHHLTARGLRRGDVVALSLPRSAEWVEALLAVHKAGGVVLPIDPAAPAARLASVFAKVPPRLVITVAATPAAGLLPDRILLRDTLDGELAALPDLDPGLDIRPDDLAYIMQTSGSTGEPKAVYGQHRVIVHAGASFADATLLGPGDRGSWTTPTGFGTTMAEVARMLVVGATVHVAEPGTLADPPAFRDWVVASGIHSVFVVTSIGNSLQRLPWPPDTPVRVLIMGGEKLHRWGPSDLPFEVAVGYGCHEALFVASPLQPWEKRLTASTATAQDRLAPPPIGRANPGVRMRILGDEDELLPVGALGEIWFGSPEAALGYWGDPALTADRFRPDAHGPAGSRLYRSGDLGRYRADGLLEHHGRTDDMVKVRGCRVELGDVETALLSHPGTAEAAVVPVRSAAGDTQLVACLVVRPGHDGLAGTVLRDFLAERLPDYMIPIAFVHLAELPRNANKKVDRRALPPEDWTQWRVRAPYRKPAEGLETTIAELWAEVLGEIRYGADDDFMDFGGGSLDAGRMLVRLRQRVPLEVSLQDLFLFPTPAALAQLLAGRRPAPVPALPAITRRRAS
ncbi:non-ribosomal peptide synthetase [Streptomyces kebangsaanensis]|uniref:non-ribosomal peptide synthetase n=1 Tax=Streptomyces kebangsaanensis TaxID=864058 RepID=UPI000A9F9BA9|nr:non-ribosomal peptide synthetase [Streptomyces kebangsaanensis]